MYYLDLVPDPLSFRGYGEYAVKLLNSTWIWINIVTNVTMATLIFQDEEELNYPIGRFLWTLNVCYFLIFSIVLGK